MSCFIRNWLSRLWLRTPSFSGAAMWVHKELLFHFLPLSMQMYCICMSNVMDCFRLFLSLSAHMVLSMMETSWRSPAFSAATVSVLNVKSLWVLVVFFKIFIYCIVVNAYNHSTAGTGDLLVCFTCQMSNLVKAPPPAVSSEFYSNKNCLCWSPPFISIDMSCF